MAGALLEVWVTDEVISRSEKEKGLMALRWDWTHVVPLFISGRVLYQRRSLFLRQGGNLLLMT